MCFVIGNCAISCLNFFFPSVSPDLPIGEAVSRPYFGADQHQRHPFQHLSASLGKGPSQRGWKGTRVRNGEKLREICDSRQIVYEENFHRVMKKLWLQSDKTFVLFRQPETQTILLHPAGSIVWSQGRGRWKGRSHGLKGQRRLHQFILATGSSA